MSAHIDVPPEFRFDFDLPVDEKGNVPAVTDFDAGRATLTARQHENLARVVQLLQGQRMVKGGQLHADIAGKVYGVAYLEGILRDAAVVEDEALPSKPR